MTTSVLYYARSFSAILKTHLLKSHAASSANVNLIDCRSVGEGEQVHHALGDVVGLEELCTIEVGAGVADHIGVHAAGEDCGDADALAAHLGGE
jgi:hypothetical protein